MISTKGRYALRVMIDIAQQDSDEHIPLKDIAQRQGISKKYLETITKELVRGKFLTAASGKGGGYKLRREIGEYTVGEILEFMEGTLAPVACLQDGAEACPREEICATLPMWKEYAAMERDFFYNKKLSDLLGQ
ncbi:MAG: Rrf2 family transcriptional regulator [Clostridiales bacterium]|nr:Rrf2 family transcriptional regulator [Clostridiales bacterium]